MPRITVVLPVYNHEAWVEEALQSLFAQDYRDFGIVAVDDGSSDASLEVLARHQSRIKVIANSHQGPAGARNRALEATDSEFVAFMDADDVCEPRRFACEMRKLENEEIGLVASTLSFIDVLGWPIPGIWNSPPHARNCYWGSLLERNWIGTPSVMIRRSVLNSTGLFDERFTHAEDYDLWLRIGRSHSIGYIDAPLIQCRRHARNTSINIDSHQRFEQQALQKVNAGEAREAFNRLYEAQQERDEAWVGFLLRSGSAKFLEEAHSALARSSRSSTLRFALAVFHYDSGDYEKARATFLGIKEQDAATIHNVGVVSAVCGDFTDAKMRLGHALSLRPGYHDARYNLDALNKGRKLRLTRRPLRTNLVPVR
jgi:glycosyltransferase involved in cell wall biosynthesis